MKSCSVIGLHSVMWPNITLLAYDVDDVENKMPMGKNVLYRDDIHGIVHYTMMVVIDMRSINQCRSIMHWLIRCIHAHCALRWQRCIAHALHCTDSAIERNNNGGPQWFRGGIFKSTNSYDNRIPDEDLKVFISSIDNDADSTKKQVTYFLFDFKEVCIEPHKSKCAFAFIIKLLA